MSIGLPSIVVTTAENQISFIKNLAQDNYIKWIGNIDQVSKQIISTALLEAMNNSKPLCKQSCKSQELVDGNGTQNVAKLLTIGPNIQTLEVRRAKISDSLLYWHWANDSTVRINAFNQHKIKWEEHQTWFNERLADFDTKLLLIESEAGPVGQVRFNRSDSNYIISYSIARQFRGLGLGQVVLTKAIDYLRQREVATLIGDVKENNLASIKIFNQLGFDEVASHQKGVIRFQLHNNILK
jgi:L-amino acid N-acyltransferase YncA